MGREEGKRGGADERCRLLWEVFVMRGRAAERAGGTASAFIRRVRVINADGDRLTGGWWGLVGVKGRKEGRKGGTKGGTKRREGKRSS